MRPSSPWFVGFALTLVLAGCGGSGPGPAPSEPAVAKKACPFYPVPHALQSCRAPRGGWVVSSRYMPGSQRCTLVFSRGGKRVWTYHGANGCTQETWVKPHLLLFEANYSVERLDPSTRAATQISGLGDFIVSPNGQWIAGDNGAGPQVSSSVFVLSIRAPKCLVVPHKPTQTDTSAKGFTPDSRNIIVQRNPFTPSSGPEGRGQLVQVSLASLQARCPSDIARRFTVR
jgi:hypothetical protein